MSAQFAILASAFVLGLVGSIHCVMMCSGFAATLQRTQQISGQPAAFKVSMAFNGGRLLSYAIAGALASWVGTTLVQAIGRHQSHMLMQLLVGGFLILVGFSIAGWWNGLGWVEKGGRHFWKLLQPLTKHVFPVTSYAKAIAAGALWGWLPCGLVYSALVLVMGSQQPVVGALAMVLFGLGTTPLMALVGISSSKIKIEEYPGFKKAIGAAVMMFGALVFTGLAMGGMAHH